MQALYLYTGVEREGGREEELDSQNLPKKVCQLTNIATQFTIVPNYVLRISRPRQTSTIAQSNDELVSSASPTVKLYGFSIVDLHDMWGCYNLSLTKNLQGGALILHYRKYMQQFFNHIKGECKKTTIPAVIVFLSHPLIRFIVLTSMDDKSTLRSI